MTNQDLRLGDIIEESMLLLGAGSTVLYQLALLGVGRGVAEHSTTLTRPVDRLRTTLTYVYVMTKGTQQERDSVARMVNKMHAPVRGEGYTAYDRDLQLWVAATLAHNGIFIHEKVFGPMSLASKEQIYRDSQVFGTALQVKPEDWPATYADFEKYWDHTLTTQLSSEPLVRDYVRKLLSSKGQPWFLRPGNGLQTLMTKGNLPRRGARPARADLVVARAEALRPVLERAQPRLPGAPAVRPVRPRAAGAARLPPPDAPGQARDLGTARSRCPNFGG